MESSRQIEDRAAAWLAKRDSGDWTPADEAQLDDWLRASTAHRVAFLRLEAGWERSERLKAFGVGPSPGATHIPPPGQWRSTPFFLKTPRTRAPGLPGMSRGAWRSTIAAMAAAVLLAIGAGIYIELRGSGEEYVTPVGGIASIPLVDGSQITLNTASRIRVALTESERRIELESGEAYFDVAPDPTRPFIVEAGFRRVIAVGTQFSVRRDGNRVDVIVTEGKVRLEPEEDGQPELLTAGVVARAADRGVEVRQRTPPELEQALSWRSGYLTFDETTLADAVAEFNRYNARRILIEDPGLAGLRISGKFRATNSAEFVQLLRDGFGVQVEESQESIRLIADR